MNIKSISSASGGTTYYAAINAMIANATKDNLNLSPEEKAKRKELIELKHEERVRQLKIIKNKCPSCDGKLTRGKKDKRNNYKRSWMCNNCGDIHSM